MATRQASFTFNPALPVALPISNTKDATVTIVKNAVPDDATDFNYTVTGAGWANFALDDDADPTLPSSRTFTFPTAQQGAKTATTTSPLAAWSLTHLVCS